MPDALQHIAQNDQHGHRRDDRCADFQVQQRVGDNDLVRAARDAADGGPAQQEGERHHKHPPHKIDRKRGLDALPNAAAAARTQILAAERRHADAQRTAWDKVQLR